MGRRDEDWDEDDRPRPRSSPLYGFLPLVVGGGVGLAAFLVTVTLSYPPPLPILTAAVAAVVGYVGMREYERGLYVRRRR